MPFRTGGRADIPASVFRQPRTAVRRTVASGPCFPLLLLDRYCKEERDGPMKPCSLIARGDATLSEANVGRLRLRTTVAQWRAIRRLQRSRTRRRAATLTLTFTDPAGNRRTLTRRLTLLR
jgi:hypothetical protein